MIEKKDIKKISDYLYEIPKTFWAEMRVPARIYVDEKMLEDVFRDRSLEQLVNTTTLPGVVKYTMAMPDCHEGYGFPIGGVAAMDLKTGVISPGGVGYDINCLGGETKILHRLGYRLKIKDFENIWPKEKIKSMNFSHGPIDTEIRAF
ncbi:MAG: RtcB family protein, partial [Patescibacteria group bacterium]